MQYYHADLRFNMAESSCPSEEQGTSTNTKRMRFSSLNEWSLSYFQKNLASNKAYYICNLKRKLPCGESRDCGTTYCKTTGPANLRYHLKNAHGLEAPSYLKELVVLANDNKDLKKKMALTTMFAPSTDSAKTQVEKLALAWCMNLRMSFKLLRDPYFISAFSASIPPGFKESDLTTAIIEYDNKLCERVKELLSNSVASLELDGGKDVNSRKLIDTGYYDTVITDAVLKMEKDGLFIASITVDNEASPNADISQAITEGSLKWLLHFRCGCHTLELLMEDLAKALPSVALAIKVAKDTANNIKNHKHLLKALKTAQLETPGHNVLKVILPCNTRKWSSGFLCIARILQLQHYLIAMAARDDLESENFILPDFQLLEYARSVLFEFYLVEQLLQRDSANVIHLSFFWYSISTKVKQTVINLHQKGFHPEANALEEKMKQRQLLMEESGVFHLCLILWPETVNLPNLQRYANREIEFLVMRQWKKWQKFADIVGLPQEYRTSDPQTDDEKQTNFIFSCRSDLMKHVTTGDTAIRTARAHFLRESKIAEEKLKHCDKLPKPSKDSKAHAFNLKAYWESIGADIPALFVLYYVLSCCAASEAGVERFFSTEGLFHDDVRSSISPVITKAVIRTRWNHDLVKRQYVREFPMDVQDVEFDE
ncbi:hypothetical protein EMCRGX_G001757 [Ephydatia muelleri]